MKKLLLVIATCVVVAAIGARLIHYLSPDQAARREIERVASEAIQSPVHLDRIHISAADGTGLVSGFTVANPKGFKAPAALTAESIKLTVELATRDANVVVLRTLWVASPQLSYEQNAAGSNFTALLENIQRSGAREPGKKIIAERLVISRAKLSYASPDGHTVTVDLPDIRLNGVGRAERGATAREFAVAIVEALLYHTRRNIPPAVLQGAPQNPPVK